MISVATLIQILISIFCAIVSGTVLWKVQIHQKLNDKRHQEQVDLAVKERELLLATAKTTELLARKFDGEGINGELHEANEELKKEREELQDFTREKFYEHTIQ